MTAKTVSDFRKAVRHGPFAWPGGYPVYWLMADGAACAFDVCKSREERRSMLEAIARPEYRQSGWRPVALQINWEDSELYCAHTNARIPSAYAEV